MGALARGYCHKDNSNKEMDAMLLEAQAEEIVPLMSDDMSRLLKVGGGEMSVFHEIAKEVADIVERKNHDYGNSYFRLRDEWGEVSFGARLGDKYHRLQNLLTGAKAQVDESIEDTIRDVIGYCLLELAYRNERRGTIDG